MDEPSVALLAAIATRETPAALGVVLSAVQGAEWTAPAAQKLLVGGSARIELACLALDESIQLVRSLFGDVPNCVLLAHRGHALSAGNPRDLLHFAQHLLDRKILRYEAGAWTLPTQLAPDELPGSLA